MFINLSLNDCTQTEHLVLVVFYKHVPFSMRPRQEPQQHSEVQGVCACSPVGVGLQMLLVAMVMGMSVYATTFRAYNSNVRRSVSFLQLFGFNSMCITGLLMSGLRFGLGGYRVALTIRSKLRLPCNPAMRTRPARPICSCVMGNRS